MDLEDVANVINNRWKTLVADVESLLTEYESTVLNPPPPVGAYWARLTIPEMQGTQASFGSPTVNIQRYVGAAEAQIFGPINAGAGEVLRLADTARAAFTGIKVSGVEFQTPSVVLTTRDDAYFQVNISCPWRADF